MIHLDDSKHTWVAELDENHLLLYWESQSKAQAVILSSEELKHALPPPILQKRLLQASHENIKVIGFATTVGLLKKAPWFAGKSITKQVLLLVKSTIHFIPSERVLRKEKALHERAGEGKVEGGNASGDSSGKSRRYKVMIVDDSSTIRSLLKRIFSESPDLEVVAAIEHPSKVEEALREYRPDVVTLDIHMPEKNGVEVLKEMVAPKNIPAVMISSVKLEEGPLVLEALSSGAIDYIEKPALENLAHVAPEIVKRIVAAAKCDPRLLARPKTTVTVREFSNDAVQNGLVLIGSSTGGTQALQEVLAQLPEKIPPIVIVQHIPAVFSKALADRLDKMVSFKIHEAIDGQLVEPGNVYIAPGGQQMALRFVGDLVKIEINDDEPVNRFKPSVDYLFDSVNAKCRKRLVAGILTGMGRDGAQGLLRLRNEFKARTFGQDEKSSVVYGMPKAAFELGAVEKQCSLSDVPRMMSQLFD